MGRELHRISGVDLTRIDGIDVGVAQTVISEVGVDMTRWKTEAHFASWLGLCPDNRITGGKVIRKGTRHVVNRAATALRLAATTLLRSQSYLGAQYRRLRGKLGAPKAITAMAHKLARLVYRMLKWGHEYVDKGLQYYEERHREQQVHLLKEAGREAGSATRRTRSCLSFSRGFLERWFLRGGKRNVSRSLRPLLDIAAHALTLEEIAPISAFAFCRGLRPLPLFVAQRARKGQRPRKAPRVDADNRRRHRARLERDRILSSNNITPLPIATRLLTAARSKIGVGVQDGKLRSVVDRA